MSDFEYTIEKNGCSIAGYKGNNTVINIPNEIDGLRVIEIHDAAFHSSPNITEVNIPDGVTYIWYYAFKWCVNLKSITIPEGVEIIGIGAFEGCRNLTSITIPKSVRTMCSDIFKDCENLKRIIFKGRTSTDKENFHIHWKGNCNAEVIFEP